MSRLSLNHPFCLLVDGISHCPLDPPQICFGQPDGHGLRPPLRTFLGTVNRSTLTAYPRSWISLLHGFFLFTVGLTHRAPSLPYLRCLPLHFLDGQVVTDVAGPE